MTKIYKTITGEILFESDSLSMKELVEKHKKWLRGANLRDANLGETYLRRANLMEAKLMDAKIGDATILNYKEISRIGNSKRLLRCFLLNDNSFYFMTGCFSGTEQELKEKVINKYGADCEYIEAIEFLKNLCSKYKGE